MENPLSRAVTETRTDRLRRLGCTNRSLWLMDLPGNASAGNGLEVCMQVRRLLMATVLMLSLASAASGQITCCACQSCPGSEICLTLTSTEDEEVCANFCNSYGCAGKQLLETAFGCVIGPVCEEILTVNSAPSLSPTGLALTALLALGLGATEVRRRERRRAAAARPS